MAANKPSIPKGTRDFAPDEMNKRNYIFDTIKQVFQRFGFQPIETPAMENLDTLLGKYGEEGDKLLFKILNSGDFLSSVKSNDFNEPNTNKLALQICEKGLRYDLTVPFARYVVQNQNDITFPFKRYQIQPVWRADRPQKGRYREFYQCDADVIGSNSLLNEVELLQIVDAVFNKLGTKVLIKLNNRKILSGIAQIVGQPDKIVDMTVAIDKLDKIGIDKVNEELQSRGFSQENINVLQPIIQLKGSTQEKCNQLETVLASSEVGLKGVAEIRTVFDYCQSLDLSAEIELDISLARGLNYYTGTIIEVKALEVEIGSICGGGRYDDLTGIFGLKNVSGVGVSFGADRIFDVLNQLNRYPEATTISTKLMFVNFGDASEKQCLHKLKSIRNAGINAELYPDRAKMNKQMTYADKKQIPYVAFIGDDELLNNSISLKNMKSGEQKTVTLDELLALLA